MAATVPAALAEPSYQLGLPRAPDVPAPGAPAALITLGRSLFFEPLLSPDGALTCATCHVPEQGFTVNGAARAIGRGGRQLTRNAPTLLNVAFAPALFRDGRAQSLEEQAWGPLLDPHEMGNASRAEVARRIEEAAAYPPRFMAAFGDPAVTPERIGGALAAYQRSLLAGGSRFDTYLYGKHANALTAEEQMGFRVFVWSGCTACHSFSHDRALFTDNRFHNVGVGYAGPDKEAARDPGRARVTGASHDRAAFRTPTLRNVALTAPYMHDGSLVTLMDVVDFYSEGGTRDPAANPLVQRQGWSYTEKKALVAFLRSLTSQTLPH